MSNWKVDQAHSNVGFKVRHMMVSNVRGSFDKIDGSIAGDPSKLSASVINFTIDAGSINTNNSDRDNHLRSGDFFDAEKFPEITFVSKNISETSSDEYDVTGMLSIRGEVKPITFKVSQTGSGKNPGGIDVVGYEAEGKISRKEFGLTWNQALEAGGVLVGDDITINIELQLNPA